MATESREAKRGLGAFLAILFAFLVLVLYLGGYVWLRTTGRLVHVLYGGIESAAFRPWELVYAPAIGIETRVRAAVDPSWNPPVVLPTSMMDGS